MDWLLLFLVLIVCIIGVGALYSAGNSSLNPWAINHIYKISNDGKRERVGIKCKENSTAVQEFIKNG